MKRSHLDMTLDQQFDNVAKAGQLIPGLELDIFDEEFNRVPHDGESVGEILVRGPWICSEYFNDPQPEKFHGDWLITGDVGKIDPEEYLIISDRSKDLVKSGGEWIPTGTLEAVLSEHPSVALVAVIPVKNERWGQRPLAVVKPRGTVSESDLKAFLLAKVKEGRIAKFWIPDSLVFVEEIPLTSAGKLNKKLLREQYSK
jgi:fatty-acyl-CoA synthase